MRTLDCASNPREGIGLRQLRWLIAGAMVVVTACDWFEVSDHSNCAVAEEAKNFTGRKLASDAGVRYSTLPTKDCIARDQRIDGGDGSDRGRVRWVVCLKGPDCDEAGMF